MAICPVFFFVAHELLGNHFQSDSITGAPKLPNRPWISERAALETSCATRGHLPRRIIIEIGALTDPDRDDYTRFLPTDPWASLPDGAPWPNLADGVRHFVSLSLLFFWDQNHYIYIHHTTQLLSNY